MTTFRGPLVSVLLSKALGLEPHDSAPIKLVALNHYVIQTTYGKLKHAGAIVATRKNGRQMSVRDRGPFWIIFPLTDEPDLDNEDFHRLSSRSICSGLGCLLKEATGGYVKSIVLMFFGGLFGGIFGPMTALLGIVAGFFIGRDTSESAPKMPPYAQTDGYHLEKSAQDGSLFGDN